MAMVLNSLAIDPRRVWKGSWRIFHEQMLDCCIPLETVQREGITMTQAACLAKCNGASTDVYPYGSVDVEEFRDMVKQACSVSDFHLIVSYSRRHFQQTGDGASLVLLLLVLLLVLLLLFWGRERVVRCARSPNFVPVPLLLSPSLSPSFPPSFPSLSSRIAISRTRAPSWQVTFRRLGATLPRTTWRSSLTRPGSSTRRIGFRCRCCSRRWRTRTRRRASPGDF